MNMQGPLALVLCVLKLSIGAWSKKENRKTTCPLTYHTCMTSDGEYK